MAEKDNRTGQGARQTYAAVSETGGDETVRVDSHRGTEPCVPQTDWMCEEMGQGGIQRWTAVPKADGPSITSGFHGCWELVVTGGVGGTGRTESSWQLLRLGGGLLPRLGPVKRRLSLLRCN
ncbi:unnamed protein product [Boreogadus saida]